MLESRSGRDQGRGRFPIETVLDIYWGHSSDSVLAINLCGYGQLRDEARNLGGLQRAGQKKVRPPPAVPRCLPPRDCLRSRSRSRLVRPRFLKRYVHAEGIEYCGLTSFGLIQVGGRLNRNLLSVFYAHSSQISSFHISASLQSRCLTNPTHKRRRRR
jgi:hypothetical protein